ncbi:LD-carboxypeptidase [Flavobacteriaceae bacterium F89]|uniref:LD-carboxypeptidase n=1 Tax=Cerina litoralis TaxID=2874477 RepID=A0AAE3EY54_9FLAO|nr:LD-carboxypeptidase [Cerina litoralis]MCG2462438.1 LD-carboxypeptidase [Cerina litoralis]
MAKRRQFLNAALGSIAIGLFPNIFYGQKSRTGTAPKIIPKRLKKGDTIGLIAPGYAVKRETLEEAKSTLVRMGFVPYHTERILGKYGYFSAPDMERAVDLNEMFTNPKIDGILCARGGYGCTRIMEMINYENIKSNPKVFIGFSDVTALLNGIYQETGLVTFHGPVGSTLNDPYTIGHLQQVVMHPKNKLVIENVILTDENLRENVEYDRYKISSGSATGKLVGGSLTLVNALVGTPWEIDFTDAIVCLEDIDEQPYRIDRMLTQLLEGKTFNKAAGVAFGVCAGCNTSTNPDSFSLKEVIMDRIKPMQIPAVYGMSFGHIGNNFTFPIGMDATLDTEKMTIQLLGKAAL